MKKILFSGMFALLVFFSSCAEKEMVNDLESGVIQEEACIPQPAGITPISDDIINGLNGFSFDIFNLMNENSKNNEFISPLSISSALAMTYAGAEGITAQQMREAVNFGPQRYEFHYFYGKMLDSLTKSDGDFEINIANAVWVQETFPLLSEYIKTVRKEYKSESQELNFIKAPEKSRKTINDWVEDKTNERIKNLIPKGVIEADTRMILTNAVYFNAEWLNYFNEKLTRQEPFYGYGKVEQQCEMMYQRNHYAYSKTGTLEILEIPYKGNKYSMMILLPRDLLGLKDQIENMNMDILEKHDQTKEWEDVMVYLPKFKLETDYELKPPLTALGMKEAFTDMADFSGMTGKKDLKISSVIHKAFIEVDERKTEAAAATAVVMKLTAAAPVQTSPIEFRADHPFMFLIRHNESGIILFMGQVTTPGV